MLIKEEELNKRLNNPLNLINRMRNGMNPQRNSAMSLFIKPTEEKSSVDIVRVPPVFNPFSNPATADSSALVPSDSESIDTPSSESIVKDMDDKVKLALAHDNALELLNSTLSQMKTKLPEMKASALSSVANSAAKVVESIRKERLAHAAANKDQDVHYHFYCPTQRKIEEYTVIEVNS